MLVDTHAHIHMDEFRDDLDEVLAKAVEADVQRIITVGTDEVDSGQALAVARAYQHIYATAGLHPHEADRGYEALEEVQLLVELDPDNIVGIGECGLDYHREGYDKDEQDRALRFQIELALDNDLPLVFHVRDAFPDFFRILDDYEGVRGVVHCFTAGVDEMAEAVERGLYVALNGIMTFTKDDKQLEAARELPLERLLLETDCPFLTPAPKRGQRNEPANVALTAKFLAELREESLEELSDASSQNALKLFGLK
jgi:TatD DNase family protein